MRKILRISIRVTRKPVIQVAVEWDEKLIDAFRGVFSSCHNSRLIQSYTRCRIDSYRLAPYVMNFTKPLILDVCGVGPHEMWLSSQMVNSKDLISL